MMDELKVLIKGIAPVIATALGSPLAGSAVAILSNVILGNDKGKTSDLLDAISNGGYDTWLKLKEAENQFTLDMGKIGIDKQKLDEMSIEDARSREIEMAKAGKRDLTTPILCFLFTGAFFIVIILMFFFTINPEMKDVANLIIGSLVTIELMIIGYYFGSSSGSKNKDDVIATHANTISKNK